MNIEEAKQILLKEQLHGYNWFNEGPVNPNDVLIYKNENGWVVAAADERASIVDTSIAYFDNESDALKNFIKKVRLEKILNE